MFVGQSRWFGIAVITVALAGAADKVAAQDDRPVVAEKDQDVGNKKRME